MAYVSTCLQLLTYRYTIYYIYTFHFFTKEGVQADQ